MVKSIDLLNQQGADAIYAWATHGVFSGNNDNTALQRLQDCDALEYLLVSNTVDHGDVDLPVKVRQLSVAPLLAEAIARGLHCQSISSILSFGEVPMPERYDNL
jgi:ribose-phosphate pyrophosphokinase